MKRKFIRKLALGISTTGLVALTFATSTYAWFKMSSKASVDFMDLQVVGGKGFMVSVDGGTYSNDLSSVQLKKSIAVAYGNGKYELGYETDDQGAITRSDVLYEVSYDNGEKKKTEVQNVDKLVNEIMSSIELLPTTSSDGRTFKDLYKLTVSKTSGRFLEFGVYFKSTSTNPDDNLKYDIYLDGFGGTDNDGNKVSPTKFTSAITNVKLSAAMNAVKYDGTNRYIDYTPGATDYEYSYKAGDSITVYSSNAARISTTVSNRVVTTEKYVQTSDVTFEDGKAYYTVSEGVYSPATVTVGEAVPFDTYYEKIEASDTYVADDTSTLIYELNDTEHKNTDLGSYATDYNKDTDGYNIDDYMSYSSECNAMFTYYNKLRRSSQIKPMKYEELPNTIKSLPTKSSDDIASSDYSAITTVESGADAKLVTFRIWLEGWDADCFDGLANAIDVRLTFGSKRIN